MSKHAQDDPNPVSGDDLLAKAAHHAYHQATKDWVMIPPWGAENCLKDGWRAAAEAVRELVDTQMANAINEGLEEKGL